MKLVVFGLSITSSWGNGHATTYRSLLRAFADRGNEVTFFERDQPWYAQHRDAAEPDYCRVVLYENRQDLLREYADTICSADAIIVGSYVPEGIPLGEWIADHAEGRTAFYDIDTPITVRALEEGTCAYLSADLVGRYDLYLSFSGGPILERLSVEFGAPAVSPFYCTVDEDLYFPEAVEREWDLGYLGTYAEDRQSALLELLVEPALALPQGRFVVAGPQYPPLPAGNVERIDHLPPHRHRWFYNAQRFTLNLTRREMVRAGFSPSVRLFEAAACGVPIISDVWSGLDTFFEPGREILLARSREDVRTYLKHLPAEESREIGRAGRRRVLDRHTAKHRAAELEELLSRSVPAEPQSLIETLS